MIETLRRVLPREIYEKVLDFRGLGRHGPEWKRRYEVVGRIHHEALQQEKSGKPSEEIFDYIKEELKRERIGWAESEQVFAAKADHEEGIYPKLILAKFLTFSSQPLSMSSEALYNIPPPAIINADFQSPIITASPLKVPAMIAPFLDLI